uniref:(northern house mosquito) hypothetical protein n=1 Tax=Culex pipiens TaxID=7175 RepID=A0A8D8ADH9_CULPI
MSSNTEVIMLKDYPPPPPMTKGLHRRKPWTREDQEVTQKYRQSLLQQIRSQRQRAVAFGRSKTLNRQFSKSANDVKEVVAGKLELTQTLSQMCLHANDDNFEVKFTKDGVRCSKTESLCDLSKIGDDCKIVELHPKPKIPEISKVAESKNVEEAKSRSPSVVLAQKVLKRQLSKSVNDVRKSGGGHFGLKVIGSPQIALSQIWTVPTHCGCCETGKDGECKRLKVEELRKKFATEEVSSAKLEKSKSPEKPKAVVTTHEVEDADDDDDRFLVVKMLSWMGRMLTKNPAPKSKWVVLQVPVVSRWRSTKDARRKATKTKTHLYLNVIVEAGSGAISITPVASFEEMIKTSVFVRESKYESTLGLYSAFS